MTLKKQEICWFLDYLRPLCKNEYSINDTQKFPSMLSSIPPLQDDEEDVSYDAESLFTNIPIQETINYIIEQIYVHKKLTPICSKLIFRRLKIIDKTCYRMYF